MNYAHWHLILNHTPVVGAPLALLVLIYGIVRRQREVEVAALMLAVVVGLLAIPAYLTGDPAEEMIEDMTGVAETAIEAHSERADMAFTAIEITGAIALLALLGSAGILGSKAAGIAMTQQRAICLFVAAALAISCALLASTANLGGRIRHPEIGMNAPSGSETEAKEGDDAD